MLNKISLLSFIICQTSIATASNNEHADKLNKYNIPSQIKTGFLASVSEQQQALKADLEAQQQAYINYYTHQFATVVNDNAMKILPKEITDTVPPLIINNCSFSPSDSTIEKATKLSSLAFHIRDLELPNLEKAKRDKITAIAFIMTANSFAKAAAETKENAADYWISGAQFLRWGLAKAPEPSKIHYIKQAIAWNINAYKELSFAPDDSRTTLQSKIVEEITLLKKMI